MDTVMSFSNYNLIVASAAIAVRTFALRVAITTAKASSSGHSSFSDVLSFLSPFTLLTWG